MPLFVLYMNNRHKKEVKEVKERNKKGVILMKKDKAILIGTGAFLGLGMVATGYFMLSDTFEPEPTKEVTVEQKKEKSIVKEKPKTNETIRTPYLSLITPVGSGEKEFPEEKSDSLFNTLLQYAESGEVDSILKEMEPKTVNYRFSTDKNLKVAGIYADASFIKSLVGKSTSEMRKLLPGTLKTPEMLALMPLFLPEEVRRPLYKDINSLTPLNPGPWEIKNIRMIKDAKEAEKDESYADNATAVSMYNVIDGLSQIYVVEMARTDDPGVPVRAYVGELTNGQLLLNGYYVPDGIKHYYKDVAFFEKLDSDYIEPNQKYQDDMKKKDAKDGEIPDEVIDEFLNPTK